MFRKKSRRKARSPRQKARTERRPPRASASGTLKTSFSRRILRALPLMLLALLFTLVLGRTTLFDELETTFLDTRMRLDAPAERSPVVILDIKDEDLYGHFRGQRSPLDPNALDSLIDAIAAGGPCLIAVDIDTHFADFSTSAAAKYPNIVWSHTFVPAEPGTRGRVPLDVLGRRDDALLARSGLPLTQSDKGVTRYYQRLVETEEGEKPSLGWAVYQAARHYNCPGVARAELAPSTEQMIIGFSRGADGRAGGGRTSIPAGHILAFAKEADWANNTLIKDKIVILGGSYLNEDVRLTPLGRMNGFEIMANVVETELRGDGVKRPGFLTTLLLQVFDGFLLIALFHVLPRRRALLLTIPVVVVLSLACSFLTYYSFAHWAFFAPVMIGVVLTFLFDEVKDQIKKRYKEKISETYQELGGQTVEK